jgi:hypothetical protein
VGPCLQSDRQTTQCYHDFLETVLQGLLKDVFVALRQSLWFQLVGAPVHCGEDVW